ncbi:MAG: GNAT family N-acetyltransferase [Candidatus Promineifilaceae bacterium]
MTEQSFFDPIFKTFPILESERFRLRQLETADAEAVYRIYANDEVTRYYDLETFTKLEQADALIRRQHRLFSQKKGIRWGITFKDKDVVIGTVGMILRTEDRQGGIGYDLGRPYWRQGIMSEVLEQVIGFGFETARLDQIQALVMPGNAASAGLLQKLGFKDKGILHNHAYFKGSFHDLHNFILSRNDVEEHK